MSENINITFPPADLVMYVNDLKKEIESSSIRNAVMSLEGFGINGDVGLTFNVHHDLMNQKNLCEVIISSTGEKIGRFVHEITAYEKGIDQEEFMLEIHRKIADILVEKAMQKSSFDKNGILDVIKFMTKSNTLA